MLDALEVAMGTSSMVESYENLRALDLLSLPKVGAPLTAIYGGRDDMIPASELAIIEEYTPQLVDIHFFEEQPHACVGRMNDIIDVLASQTMDEAAAA